jgi:phosphoribosylformylglycinamidine synthase
VGARVSLPEDGVSSFVYLFSESAGRALVAVPRGHDKAFVALAADYGVPCTPIGVTAGEPLLEVRDEFVIPLAELRDAWSATLPKLFGGVAELAGRQGDPEGAADPAVAASPEPAAADPEAAAEAAVGAVAEEPVSESEID